jgi:prepilin-type N-terminal cleavage/methylation domain-containing protein
MLQSIQRSKQPVKGFTLLELLVVISIMLMIAGAGGYYIVNSGRSSRFKGSARAVKDKLILAQTSARVKGRGVAVRASQTENTREWKIVTVDSIDGRFGNDDDRQIDKKPYYLPKTVSLDEEQEVVFTSDGSISRSTTNTIVLTDTAKPEEPWKITLSLYKAGGSVKMSGIIKHNTE